MKIYESDGMRRSLVTKVTGCEPAKNGHFYVTLEDTIFFPEGGGQYADQGKIYVGTFDEPAKLLADASAQVSEKLPADASAQVSVKLPADASAQVSDQLLADTSCIHVLDGQEQGNRILYETDAPIEPGTTVTCLLDWDLRFSRMQQHTGEHMLSGLIHSTYGYDNVGFHLSDDAPVTLDINGPLTYEQVMELEKKVNSFIYQNLPIIISFPSKEALARMTYRSKIEIEGQVRIVTVGPEDDPLDICACCAPHPETTGAVGMIKVITYQHYKGGVRIGILCGERARAHFEREWKRVTDISKELSTNPENLASFIHNMLQEIQDLRHKLAEGAEKRLMKQIEEFGASFESSCSAEASAAELPAAHLCLVTEEDLEPGTMKNGFNALAAKTSGYVGLFVGDDAAGYRFYAGSTCLDSRELAGKLRQALGAKGGGSREMIQGKISATKVQLEEFFGGL